MKKEYKSIISICLILAMIMVSSTMAFAQGESLTYSSKGDIVTLLQEMGGIVSELSKDGNKRAFEVAHENGINSVISETIIANGDIEYNITEGDICNIVLLKADGTVYLDGEPVTLTTSTSTNTATNYMKPMAVNYYYNTTSPPAGSASSYTQEVQTYNTSLNLGTTVIIGLTYAAFCIILGALSTLAGIVTGILTAIFAAGQALTPYSNHMSFKTTTYYSTESNNGYFGTSLFVVKNKIKHYGNSNYTGYLGTTTSYGVTVL